MLNRLAHTDVYLSFTLFVTIRKYFHVSIVPFNRFDPNLEHSLGSRADDRQTRVHELIKVPLPYTSDIRSRKSRDFLWSSCDTRGLPHGAF